MCVDARLRSGRDRIEGRCRARGGYEPRPERFTAQGGGSDVMPGRRWGICSHAIAHSASTVAGPLPTPVLRGVRRTSAGETHMSFTRHAWARCRVIAALECTTMPASGVAAACRVITTLPPCQKASAITLSTKTRMEKFVSRGERSIVSILEPRKIEGEMTPLRLEGMQWDPC